MLPSSMSTNLSVNADVCITKVLECGGARTSKPNGEVSAVRTLVLDGFDEICTAWSPILKNHGFRINLHTVFCHSRPHVTFPKVPHAKYTRGPAIRRCELADLLIVVDHIDPFQNIDERRAVLIQAKLLKGGMLKPSGAEWIQHELLGWLPTFTFVDKAYDLRSRDLRGMPTTGLPGFAAEYGGIDLKASPTVWNHWLTATMAPWFTSEISLAQYLAGMVTGDTSCSRDAVRGGTDDWSFTVDELLRVTAARPITKKSGVLRGNDNLVGFGADTSSLITLADGGGEDYVDGEASDWPDGPISTVHITVRSLDDRSDE